MIKYIKIINYTCGDSLKTQVNKIFDEGLMDKNTRLYFANSNCLTTKEIREMLRWFEIKTDDDFNKENIVFAPKEWILRQNHINY